MSHELADYCVNVSLTVSKILSRALTIQENAYLVSLIRRSNLKYPVVKFSDFAAKRLKKLAEVETKTYKRDVDLIRDDVDIHLYLDAKVKEGSSIPRYNTSSTAMKEGLNASDIVNPINVANFFGLTDTKDVLRTFNPSSLYLKNYMIMDSRYRNLSTDGTTTFQWQYNDMNDLLNQGRGVNTSGGTVRNIISLKLYQFMFPNVDTLNNDSGRLSIYIQELKDASFIASGGTSYHWLLRVAQGEALPQPSPLFVQCQVEDYQDGIVYFNKPIVNIDKFTINFYDPLNVVTLPYDRSAATLAYGATTTITTTIDNNLSVGGRVIISGFTTNDPTVDKAVIAQINNPLGVVVTNILTPQAFTVDIDTSTITPTPGLVVQVYFAQFRFIMGFEITYLKD